MFKHYASFPPARLLSLQKTNAPDMLRQLAEICFLRFGYSALGASDYFRYELFDGRRYNMREKQAFLGWRGQRKIDREFNDPGWHFAHSDKIVTAVLLERLGARVPALRAIADLRPRNMLGVRDLMTIADCADFFSSAAYPLFAKPVDNALGRGAMLIRGYDQSRMELKLEGGKRLALGAAFAAFRQEARCGRGGMLVQDCVRPHPEISPLSASKLPTIRFIALCVEKPVITHGVVKFPTGQNVIDNFRGGQLGNILARVDLASGRLTAAYVQQEGRIRALEHHTDSGLAFADFRIPDWPSYRELIEEVGPFFRGMALQHWDVAVGEDGPVILELNGDGCVELPQIVTQSGFCTEAVAKARSQLTERKRSIEFARSEAAAPSRPVPVIVLGAGTTALGTLRCLAKAWIPAYCPLAEKGIEASSRHYKAVPGMSPLHESESLAQYLEFLPFEKAVLMPCSDRWISRLNELPGHLLDRFPACSPVPACATSKFTDKAAFARLLTECGAPHPRTFIVDSEEDIEAAGTGSLEGFFLKPRDSQSFFKKFQVKGIKVRGKDDCSAKFRQLRNAGFELILQEYIPGPANKHFYIEGFIDRNAKLGAAFARQRLRMFPADFGNSTCMISIGLAAVQKPLEDLLKVFKVAGYRGIFSAELKLDERDGEFKFIEINVRPWWYIEFAAICGVNVAEMAYYDAMGIDCRPQKKYRIGVTSVDAYSDWQVWRKRPLGQFVADPSGAKAWLMGAHTVLSWRDPLPSIGWFKGMVGAKLRRNPIFSPFASMPRKHT